MECCTIVKTNRNETVEIMNMLGGNIGKHFYRYIANWNTTPRYRNTILGIFGE